jgi:hypothetical protein
MPYRHAHWCLLALFPLIAVAFWPHYLGQFGDAPFALHAHGLTAAAWLALLTLQSWSIHARRVALHRAAGLATFVVLPLFAAAGPLALQGMAMLSRTNADPFHAANGAALVFADVLAGPAVVILVIYAFANRRRVQAHAAAMLATALLAAPPVLARLLQLLPFLPEDGAERFRLCFHLSEAVMLGLALWLAARRPQARAAFGFAALVTAAQMIGFETVARAAWWDGLVLRLTDIPTAPMALAAAGVTVMLLYWAWASVPPRSPAVPRAATAPDMA